MIIFGGFEDFLIYLEKYFWSLLNSFNFDFPAVLRKSHVNKRVQFFFSFVKIQGDYNG